MSFTNKSNTIEMALEMLRKKKNKKPHRQKEFICTTEGKLNNALILVLPTSPVLKNQSRRAMVFKRHKKYLLDPASFLRR